MDNISKDTIIRTIVLVVALINQILTTLNINPLPFSNEETYSIVSTIVMAIASIWAWWKNNSITKNAIKANNAVSNIESQNSMSFKVKRHKSSKIETIDLTYADTDKDSIVSIKDATYIQKYLVCLIDAI